MALLHAEPESGIDKTAAKSKLVKGDRRIVVTCDEIEEIVFGNRHDPLKTFGRRKNRATRALGGNDEWKSVDMEDDQDSSSDQDAEVNQPQVRPLVRPSQLESDVNGAIGGEKGRAEHHNETPEELQKRVEGQQRAEEREMVRRAARRGVVFGFVVDSPEHDHQQQHASRSSTKGKAGIGTDQTPPEERKKCEAVMNGAVVEPSFAKGNWAIRWRE